MISGCSWNRPVSPKLEVENGVPSEEHTCMNDPDKLPSPLFSMDVGSAHRRSETIQDCLRCHGGGPGGPPPVSFDRTGMALEPLGSE